MAQEPKRAPDFLLMRGDTSPQGSTGGVTDGSGAVVETHSTDEGGEPQGSRKGRPRNPLEGREGPSGRIGRGRHSRDTELGRYVHETRPTICPWGRRLSRNPGV